MNDESTKAKNSSVLSAIEILLGLVALSTGLLNHFDFMLFISIAGPTMVLFGIALLAVGVFRLVSIFLYGLSSLPKKVNTITSILTISTALMILYFQMLSTGETWLHLLFGIGLLSYGIGRITFGVKTSELNSGLRALITLLGFIIAAFSIIVISFPMVRIYSHANLTVYLTYAYFVDITFILIGIDSLALAIADILLTRHKLHREHSKKNHKD